MPDTATMGGVTKAAPNPTPPETQPNEESTPTTMPGTGETVPDMVEQTAKEVGVPISILRAEAQQESQFRQQARSQKGAVGVMQLMPKTAKALGVNPENPEENIRGGATYLKQLHDQFGDWEHALAAYDWGPRHVRNAVREYGDDWLAHAPQETRNYVNTILSPDTMSGEGEHLVSTAIQPSKPKNPQDDIRQKYNLPSSVDLNKSYYENLENNQNLNPWAFSQAYAEAHPKIPSTVWQKAKEFVQSQFATGHSGVTSPSDASDVLAPFTWVGTEAASIPITEYLKGLAAPVIRDIAENVHNWRLGRDAAQAAEAEGHTITLKPSQFKVVENEPKPVPTPQKQAAEPTPQPEALITIPGAVPIKDATRPLPENEYLYHATDKSHAAAIEKNGLRANTWFAKTPQDALRSGAVPISGNRGDLRIYAVPKAEVTPAVPDQADIGAREVEKGRFVQSTAPHVPSHEVTGNGHIVRSLRPEPTEALPAQMTPEEAVNAAGGIFRGMNSAGLVEITLPREMTDRIPGLNDRMKDFVSITLPREQVTPENVKAAMDKKLADFGVKDQRFIHYSQTPVEGGTLEGGRRGEAQAGSEQARLQHENAVPGVYAYREGTQPESQIGSRLHKSTFTNNGKIADISGAQKDSFEYVYQQAMNRYKEAGDNDTIASQKALNDAEASLQAAGFAGYEHKAGRAGTVFLFGDQPIEQKAPPLVPSILEAHEANGGSTFNPTKSNLAGTDNYAVAMYPQRGEVINGKLTPEAMQKFIDKNADLLKDPNNSIGTWTNEGKQYLDIVHTIPDRAEAIRLGRENNQKAIFDLKNMQEIPTGGTGEIPVSAPEINMDLHDSLKNQFEKQMDEKPGAISDHKESGDFGFLWRDGTSGYIGNYGDAEGAHDDMMQTMQESLQRNVGGTNNMFRDAGVANWHLGENGDLTVSVPTGATLSSDQIAAITSEARKLGSSQVIVATGDEAPSDYVNGKIVPNPKYKEVDIKNPTPADLSKHLRDTFGENITPATDIQAFPSLPREEERLQAIERGENPTNELPVPLKYQDLFDKHGYTWQNVRAHEAGHAIIADAVGFGVGNMEGADPKSGNLASQIIEYTEGRKPVQATPVPGEPGQYYMKFDAVKERLGDVLAVLMGGGVSQEVHGGVRFDDNPGVSGDMFQARRLLKELRIPQDQWQSYIEAAKDRARNILTHPTTKGILDTYTKARTINTPENLHMTSERVNEMVRKIREAREGNNEEGIQTENNAPGHGEAVGGLGREPNAGREGAGTGESQAAIEAPRAEINTEDEETAGPFKDEFFNATTKIIPKGQISASTVNDQNKTHWLLKDGRWSSSVNIRPHPYPPEHYGVSAQLTRELGIDAASGMIRSVGTNNWDLVARPTEKQLEEIGRVVKESGFPKLYWDMIPNDSSPIHGSGSLGEFRRAVDEVYPEDEETAFPFGAKASEEQGPHTISTRFPSAVKATENPVENHELKVDAEALANTPGLTEKLAAKVKDYPGSKIPKNAKPETTVKAFIRHVADNIKYIYDKTTPAEREMSAQWYPVGAHKMTQDMADNNGISHRQAAGVVAALSPQKDWDMNASLARRAIEIYKNQQDTVTTPEMLDTLRTIASIPANNSLLRFRSLLEGKTLGELSGDEQALWLRLYDEAHNSRNYEAWSPDGTSKGIATKANGEPGKVAWGNLNEISKALKILDDGSRENISRVLGKGHKVRSFYNNIIEPNSDRHDITVDTHAVAAGLLRPLSATDIEVNHNFGKAGKSSITGVQGTYPLFADAYRLAAKELDIQHPNQLQSIVWEHIRNLFNSEFKTPENKAAIDAIWKEYKDGKIGAKTARNKIYDYAERHRAESIGEGRTAENEGELSEGGVSGTGARPATSGIGGRTASLLAGGTKGKTGTFLDFLPKPKFAKPYAGTK